MNSITATPASITVTPVFVADLLAESERMPLYVHVIDHPDARVLVDTGITELHPAVADLDPRLRPLGEQDFDLAGIDIVARSLRSPSAIQPIASPQRYQFGRAISSITRRRPRSTASSATRASSGLTVTGSGSRPRVLLRPGFRS